MVVSKCTVGKLKNYFSQKNPFSGQFQFWTEMFLNSVFAKYKNFYYFDHCVSVTEKRTEMSALKKADEEAKAELERAAHTQKFPYFASCHAN